MRRFFVIAAVLLLAPCNSFGSGKDAETAAANKAVVISALEALNHQQYEDFDQFFAPDLKRHCQATPDVEINSLEEMIPFVKEWYSAFPDASMETRKIIAEGDLVACWGTFVGTHEAPMGDIPATNKQMVSETFAFFRVAGGKIAEMWVTWDNMAIMKQLGLMPPKPEPATDEEP